MPQYTELLWENTLHASSQKGAQQSSGSAGPQPSASTSSISGQTDRWRQKACVILTNMQQPGCTKSCRYLRRACLNLVGAEQLHSHWNDELYWTSANVLHVALNFVSYIYVCDMESFLKIQVPLLLQRNGQENEITKEYKNGLSKSY